MKHFTCLLLFAFTARLCVATDLSVPIHLFVRDLFENPETRIDFREMWTGTPNASGRRADPNGGYLFRFTLQFEGSDDLLVFLATDRFGDLPRSLPSWSIFQETSENSWKMLNVEVCLNSVGLLVYHPSRTFIQEFPDRFEEGKTSVSYKVDRSGVVVENRYRSEVIPLQVKKMIEEEAVFVASKVEKIPLLTYLRSPQAKWRPISEHGMEAQSLDPDDAPYLASIMGLSWAAAVKLYGEFDEMAMKVGPKEPAIKSP